MNFFRNSLVGKITFFLLLFLFVYPFKLVGLPVSFRVLFSLFGGLLLLIRLLAIKKVYFSSRILYLSISALTVSAVSVVSVYLVNHTGDNEFVNFWLMPVLCLLSAYFVISFGLYAFPHLDFILLSKYYVAVVLAQALISVAMFANPAVYAALLRIQQMDELDMSKSEQSMGARLLGLGASFMIMGVINCVALLLTAVLLKRAKLSTTYRIYLIVAYLIIFVIGMMQARTTVVGFLVSLAYLCFSSVFISAVGIKRSAKQIIGIVLIALMLVAGIFVFAKDLIDKNQQIIQYGFELLVNYQKKGKLESASTNDLGHMYSIVPEKTKTYLIGDGKFNVVPGTMKYGFYMHTDVGFARLLFYFGIPGLIVFAIYQFLLVKYSFTVPLPDYRFLIFYFFLLVVLWNLKNVIDTNILFTPFCLLNILRTRRRHANETPVSKEKSYQYA